MYYCITYQKSFTSRRISKKCKTLYVALFSSRIWMWQANLRLHLPIHHQNSFWGDQIFRQIQTTKLSDVVILKVLVLVLIIKINGINASLKIPAQEVDIQIPKYFGIFQRSEPEWNWRYLKEWEKLKDWQKYSWQDGGKKFLPNLWILKLYVWALCTWSNYFASYLFKTCSCDSISCIKIWKNANKLKILFRLYSAILFKMPLFPI